MLFTRVALVRRVSARVGVSGAGHSKGGDSVVTYAAKYDDIPKVVNVSGRFHLDKGETRALRPALPPSPFQQR